MDVVVKSVVLAAVDVGTEACEKIRAFAKKQYEENESVRKACDCSKNAVNKAVGYSRTTVKRAEEKVGSIRNDFSNKVNEYRGKAAENEFIKKAGATGETVREGLEKGSDAIECSKLFYQLGKLVYEQAVSKDHSEYTYPIVEKLHAIAAIKDEDDLLSGGGWTPETEKTETSDDEPQNTDEEKKDE